VNHPEITDSRYIPIPQKKYHCVPACLQMILGKLGLHVPTQDEIGYNLGVVVPPEEAANYVPVRVGVSPDGYYGTRLDNPRYDFNKVSRALGWGVKMSCLPPATFKTPDSLVDYLARAEKSDRHIIICYDFLTLYKNGGIGGHANLFDRIIPEGIRVIEPIEIVSRPDYLWRIQDPDKLLEAMRAHENYMGGIWEIA
jgi:hypothetical protein